MLEMLCVTTHLTVNPMLELDSAHSFEAVLGHMITMPDAVDYSYHVADSVFYRVGPETSDTQSQVIKNDAAREPGKTVEKLMSALDRLEEFRFYEADWDGYGAEAPTSTAIDAAVAFLRKLPLGCPAPHISLKPDGEPLFYWKSSGCYIDLTFGPDGTMSYLVESPALAETGEEGIPTSAPARDLWNTIFRLMPSTEMSVSRAA
ncbi:MAG: hypothetical protein F9K30_24270 [Dechloromonas sp.]|nr:MAG: hypothetical protein F9K30_24270 [Dechloromonas sp.]